MESFSESSCRIGRYGTTSCGLRFPITRNISGASIGPIGSKSRTGRSRGALNAVLGDAHTPVQTVDFSVWPQGQVQVLICVAGRGWYQEWGKPAVQLIPGTIIEIPEGVKHWHGAAADSWMLHLTFHRDVLDGATNEWLEPVSEEQYQRVR